jgi:catechol 2,3-dioxygenase
MTTNLPRGPGLYHVAVRYPDRPALAPAVRRPLEHDAPLEGAADHGVSEAGYVGDLAALLAEA